MAVGSGSVLRATAAATLALLTVGGCSCDDTGIAVGESRLDVSPRLIDFGRVFIGQTKFETIDLKAPGQVAILYGTSFEGTAAGFKAGPAEGRISPNGTQEITVFFTPELAGPRRATLIFASNATRNATVTVELTAVAVEPPDCEDGNGCTVDEFDLEAGVCTHRAEPLACDDFNACTTTDTCVEGVCLGQARSCDDGDVCTDDLCDPRMGCVNVATTSCDDGNPCTADVCQPEGGCDNPVLEDGTPCNDLEQCTIADICIAGSCFGVAVDDGTVCDDGDPCSTMDACLTGECLDSTYTPPGFGDLKFATELGALAADASQNVILDREDTMFVATSSGVAAVDLCGELLWTNDEIGEPSFSGAVSLPGLLTLPIGGRLVELDTQAGAVLREVDFAPVFVRTSSTATVTMVVEDVAIRASGGLVVSVWRTVDDGTREVFEGMIAEVDRTHSIATAFRPLGERYASRVAVDADEGVVAILERGRPGDVTRTAQLVRFGVGSVPGDTWSTSEVEQTRTDLAIGTNSEVLWSAGLVTVDKGGTPLPIFPAPLEPAGVHAGAPVMVDDLIFVVVRREDPAMPSFAPGGSYHLLTVTASSGDVIDDVMFESPVVGMSPVVDIVGNVFVMTSSGQMLAFTAAGDLAFELGLPIDNTTRIEDVALGITSRGAVVGASGRHAFGVQSIAPMSGAAWPRHRRDNLSTGHR